MKTMVTNITINFRNTAEFWFGGNFACEDKRMRGVQTLFLDMR